MTRCTLAVCIDSHDMCSVFLYIVFVIVCAFVCCDGPWELDVLVKQSLALYLLEGCAVAFKDLYLMIDLTKSCERFCKK